MKKKLIFMVLFCTISGALGSVAGWFLGGMFKKTPDITNKEYVDGVKLAQRFFAPIQEQLYENSNNAIEYARIQTKKIKQEFSKKFAELDKVLNKKLQELEECANDNKNVERRIRESQAKLKWLEEIQIKTKAILDI